MCSFELGKTGGGARQIDWCRSTGLNPLKFKMTAAKKSTKNSPMEELWLDRDNHRNLLKKSVNPLIISAAHSSRNAVRENNYGVIQYSGYSKSRCKGWLGPERSVVAVRIVTHHILTGTVMAAILTEAPTVVELSALVPDTTCGISSLAPELLCAIFSFIRAESSSAVRTQPSVHTLTRVSSLWRSVSHNLPELWTDIRIFHCGTGQLEMLSEYLRRSNTLPLDISFDLGFNVARHRQRENFWPLVLKIWSVAHRWRTLRIATTVDNFSSMQLNVGRKAAPLLESLELQVSESESFSRPSLFFGSMPVLQSLVLDGIGVQTEASSFVEQLETLNLSFDNSADLIVQLADAFDAASINTTGVPPLRHLTLRAIRLPGTSTALKSYVSLLTTLTLGSFHSEHFSLVYLPPLLEELTLENLTDRSWQAFSEALRTESLTLPALRILKLSSIVQCSPHKYFSSAFPALEQLSLIHLDSSTFLSAFSRPSPVLWPHLHSLTIHDANYRALCLVVEVRMASGHPLAALEVDSPQFIDTGSLQWLQKHVKGFKRNLRA
ncbi:hypothetical protein DFH09DRAFT_1284371 [Mycena vulgaris]|nr:hypothetical protein DFH09DRAFT_1284371 [Mycena vulgaris]